MATVSYSCDSTPLTAADFNDALVATGADAAAIWSLLTVESGKAGYLPDRRPQILFERAIFHRQTNGAYDQSHPGISAPTWGGYLGGAGEYARLGEAYALAPDAALQSASWGIAQVMGFNYSKSGFASAADYVQAACGSEAAQLKAFVNFLRNSGIAPLLAAHQWDAVAERYNGSGQVADYSGRLQQNYARLSDAASLPDINVRAAQMLLTFLAHATGNAAFNPGGIDGILGRPGSSHTLAALNAWQAAGGLAATTAVDDGVLAALAAALPAAQMLELS